MTSMARRFIRDERGNYAMMTAVLILPLILGTGLAIDASNISRKHNELQQAADAAVLAIAREGEALTDEKAAKIAQQFLAGNFDLTLTNINITRRGTRVDLGVDSRTSLAFGGAVGRATWPVVATSSADIAYAKYEIGLVLDTTGSMAGGKIASLKDAATGLIDDLSASTPPERLKMAMVPFAAFVNVGPQYAPSFDKKGKVDKKTGAWWLDIEGKTKIEQVELKDGTSRFEVYNNIGRKWPGCVETRAPDKKNAYDVADIAPVAKKPETLFVPALSIDEGDNPALYGNSYIVSALDPVDKSVPAKIAKTAKYGVQDILGVDVLTPVTLGTTAETKGPGAGCNSQPITPLTSDLSILRASVGKLNAAGNTNILEGVMWGWRVLSPREPFTEGKPAAEDLRKIMIVLTDGKNEIGVRPNPLGSNYSSFGFLVDGRLGVTSAGAPTANDLMNDKTLAACNNAKADGIEIFTIRLEEPDMATGYMLKDCATDEAHFIDVPSRTQLDEAFKVIQDRIVRIRIAS